MRHDKGRQLIYATPNGYVHRCACCSKLTLSFGNVIIDLALEQLSGLSALFSQLDMDEMEANNRAYPSARKILIQVPNTQMMLAFSREEAEELCRLLNGARQIAYAPSLAPRQPTTAARWN